MAANETGLKRLFIQELIKAVTRGVIFLIVIWILLFSIKQDIKEGIAFGIDRFIADTTSVATDPYLIGKAKQLVKEGIEYSVAKMGHEVRYVTDARDDALEMKDETTNQSPGAEN
jgi:hypothetical protein